jgi:diguanylate cyclase (GGDEF)-like protein
MATVVSSCGHSIRAVGTLAEARDAIASREVDLLITALELDDGDAAVLLRELGSSGRDLPVIVASSTTSDRRREELFSLGALDVVAKNELAIDRFSRYFSNLARADELQSYLQGLSVAVLDDSRVTLELVRHVLTLNGVRGEYYSDPKAFLADARRRDVYLVDYVLPGTTGDAVISELRQRDPDAVIVCVSGLVADRALSNALLAGADDYLAKPFRADELMARLKIDIRARMLLDRLRHASTHDAMTGALNHAQGIELLKAQVETSRRYGRPLAVLMCDLDDFKLVNDRFGHLTGDAAIVAVSRQARETLRGADSLCRYGGEEFLAIMPETCLADALAAGEKLASAIRSMESVADGLALSLSVGAAAWRDGDFAETLLARADANLYEAKRTGKNKCVAR